MHELNLNWYTKNQRGTIANRDGYIAFKMGTFVYTYKLVIIKTQPAPKADKRNENKRCNISIAMIDYIDIHISMMCDTNKSEELHSIQVSYIKLTYPQPRQ